MHFIRSHCSDPDLHVSTYNCPAAYLIGGSFAGTNLQQQYLQTRAVKRVRMLPCIRRLIRASKITPLGGLRWVSYYGHNVRWCEYLRLHHE
jgi:hypothetical protein